MIARNIAEPKRPYMVQNNMTCIDEISTNVIKANVNTYLLTYSMVQGPSWAADWLATSQEIPRISRNPKVIVNTVTKIIRLTFWRGNYFF